MSTTLAWPSEIVATGSNIVGFIGGRSTVRLTSLATHISQHVTQLAQIWFPLNFVAYKVQFITKYQVFPTLEQKL